MMARSPSTWSPEPPFELIQLEFEALFRVNRRSGEDCRYIRESSLPLVRWVKLRTVMHQNQLPDIGFCCHLRRAHSPGLSFILAPYLHPLLEVPAHRKKDVSSLGEFSNALTGFGVAGKDHRPDIGVDPIGKTVKERLHVLCVSGRDSPM